MKDDIKFLRYTRYMNTFWIRHVRKILSIVCYIVVPLFLIGTSVAFSQKDTFLYFGEVAKILLVGLLFIKPIAVLSKFRVLMITVSFRRQLGVATFWFALFHSIGFLYLYDLTQVSLYLDPTYHLLYGAIAMIGMAILGVTSNDRSVQYFRKKWVKLQYLAYPTLFFTLLHVSMVEGELLTFFVLFGVYAVLKYFEWKK